MANILKKYPWHIILFVSYLILFLFQENEQQLELNVIWRSLAICLLATLTLFATLFLFLRDRLKAGILTTALNLVLFNYGVVYDLVEKLYFLGFWPFKNIHRYLLILAAVYAICMIWLVIKKVRSGEKMNYFLNVLLLFLVAYNLVLLTLNYQQKYTVLQKEDRSTNQNESNLNLPNLYYIVLDGYANNTVLKEFYKYDNYSFLNYLNEQGFIVADSANSNYYSTLPSLAATLNMDYHKDNSNNLFLLKNNAVFAKLKQLGYSIVNLESGYSVTESFTNCDSTISIHAPNEFERSLMKFTILRLDDLFGVLHYKRLSNQIKCLKDIKLQPKRTFYFIHIVAPHPPYVFDENGKHLYSSKTHHNSWEPKAKYLQQLKYMNNIMQEFVKKVRVSDPTGAIILQSDHGPWISDVNDKDVFKARSMILNTFCFPGKNQKFVYSSVSSVNTFRAFFKTYVDSTITFLRDSSAGKNDLLNSVRFKDLRKDELHE